MKSEREQPAKVAFAWAKKHGLTLGMSIGVHALVTAGASWLAFRSLVTDHPSPAAVQASAPVEPSSLFAVELPQVGEGAAIDVAPVDPVGIPPREAAGDPIAHPDTGSASHGGDPTDRTPAQNLADTDERMRLSPELLSRLDRDQLQRLRVARARMSWEDRRATTHPAELTLVVSGPGLIRERRTASTTEPSRGAFASPSANVRGAALGFMPSNDPGDRSLGGEQVGGADAFPGRGLQDRAPGPDHREAAPVGSARPAVTRGPVAVPASDPARPRDNVDGEQEVATTIRSLVHASAAGGLPGEGEGGTGGGGVAGAGDARPRGPGFRASPLGDGAGLVYDYWTRDPRLLPYFRRIHARIDPLWANAFPKSALLELEQGTVILEFTILANGGVSVSWPPVRPSGIDEFDRNCADAIRRAAPFPPLPASLGVTSLRIRAPFVADNPIVK